MERPMFKQFIITGLAVLMLSVGPSAACDPEEMIKELRAQCADAVKAAVQLIEPLNADFTEGERSIVDVRLKQAGALCNDDKYSDGYAVTVKLARFLGHVEARKGITPVF
jgi:hypothetical protein